MTVQIFCPKCQSFTKHSGQECLPCEEWRWEKLSLEEKLADLYRRIVKIDAEKPKLLF